MRKLVLFLLLPLLAYGQESKVDESFGFDIPFGSKVIDIGFSNRQFLNVSTIEPTDNLLLRWVNSQLDSTVAGFALRFGVIKCPLTDKEFGLVSLDSLRVTSIDCLNWVSAREIGDTRQYLLRVAKFDYIIQVIAFDTERNVVAMSQVRLVKQKRKN